MKIYNRTNIPKKTAIEAVSLIITGKKSWDRQQASTEQIDDNMYQVNIFKYPPMNITVFSDNSAMILLAEENEQYQNMQPGEESSIYYF